MPKFIRVTLTKDTKLTSNTTSLTEEDVAFEELNDKKESKLPSQHTESFTYTVTKPVTSLRYTIATLLASGVLATGSVVLFYDSNKLVGKFKALDVFKLLGGVVINWVQNVYFSKDTIDTLRNLSKGDQPLGLRIARVGTGLVVGIIATVPSVVAEYAESKALFNTLLQVCGLPMNIVGTFSLFDEIKSLGQSIFREKQPLYDLTYSEHALMEQAQKAMLINLQRVWAEIKLGNCVIPYEGSLPTKLFIALNSLTHGEDLTSQNKALYYMSRTVDITLSVANPVILMAGAAGYLASSMRFFLDGPISWLHFGPIGSWFAGVGVMMPQYGLSILASVSVATIIGELVFSTSFAQGMLGKIKNLLPNIAMLDNNWMRGVLGLGLLSALVLGPFSGATSQTLYEKYFPDFRGKSYFSGFINGSTVGFNMYYYFAVAILEGIAGYYRNYGTDKQRATTASLDNFRELLAEIRKLSADEIPHLLLKLHELVDRNTNISNDLDDAIETVDEETRLITNKEINNVTNIIEKAVGTQIANSIPQSFWRKTPAANHESTRPSLQATRYSQLHKLSRDGKTIDEAPDAEFGDFAETGYKKGDSKRCPGVACTIL